MLSPTQASSRRERKQLTCHIAKPHVAGKRPKKHSELNRNLAALTAQAGALCLCLHYLQEVPGVHLSGGVVTGRIAGQMRESWGSTKLFLLVTPA